MGWNRSPTDASWGPSLLNRSQIPCAESLTESFGSDENGSRSTAMKMFLLSCFLISTTLLPLQAQDTAMFRGNLQHTGVYSATGLPKFNAIRWKFHTGGRVIGSP